MSVDRPPFCGPWIAVWLVVWAQAASIGFNFGEVGIYRGKRLSSRGIRVVSPPQFVSRAEQKGTTGAAGKGTTLRAATRREMGVLGRLARKWGFPEIGLHSMRHTFGSQLLSLGVPLPVVSKILGHSNPRVTAEIYSHALPADEEAAVESWEALMRPILTPKQADIRAHSDRVAANGSTQSTSSRATN